MISAKLVKELRDLTGAGMLDCKKALEATEGNVEKAVDWLREQGISSAQKKSGRIAAEGSSKVLVDGNRAIIVEVNSETDFVAKNEQFIELVDTICTTLISSDAGDVEAALQLEAKSQTLNDWVIAATATIGEKITLRRFEILEKADDETFGAYIHMGGKISAVAVVKNGDSELAKDIAMQVASMNPSYISRQHIPGEVIEHERNIQVEVVKNDAVLSGKPEKVINGIIEGRVSKSLQEISLVDQPFFKDSNLKVSQVLKNAGADVIKFVRYAVGEGIQKREENFAEEVSKAKNVN